MARNLEIYPKAILDMSGTWTLRLRISDNDTGQSSSTPEFSAPGSPVPEIPLLLLKIVFWLSTPDDVTDQDVLDAFTIDDVQPGGGTASVWGNWIARANDVIAALPTGYTVQEFWAWWSTADTNNMRNDARNALEDGPGSIGRGWTITGFHQHEPNGSTLDG